MYENRQQQLRATMTPGPRDQRGVCFVESLRQFLTSLSLSAPTTASLLPLALGKRRYNIKLWKTFTDCFNCLPIAAIVDEKIFCVHGGLSPEHTSMDQIRRIPRPTDVPDSGVLCDLLWSDPDKDIEGWGENDRGVSFTFGGDVVAKFLKKHDLDLVCRAHQVVEDGYEFFAKRRLVTIFSAPNYWSVKHTNRMQSVSLCACLFVLVQSLTTCLCSLRSPLVSVLQRRVRQCRRDDVGGRDSDVQLPDPQTSREEGSDGAGRKGAGQVNNNKKK